MFGPFILQYPPELLACAAVAQYAGSGSALSGTDWRALFNVRQALPPDLVERVRLEMRAFIDANLPKKRRRSSTTDTHIERTVPVEDGPHSDGGDAAVGAHAVEAGGVALSGEGESAKPKRSRLIIPNPNRKAE